VVDRNGVPLAVKHSAANVHDSKMLEEMVDTIQPIRGPRSRSGRPRKRGIKARIARRGVDSSERLGRHRWVVERTLSWLNRYRRLKVRYEQRADIHQAFLDLGCAQICWGYVQRFC